MLQEQRHLLPAKDQARLMTLHKRRTQREILEEGNLEQWQWGAKSDEKQLQKNHGEYENVARLILQ